MLGTLNSWLLQWCLHLAWKLREGLCTVIAHDARALVASDTPEIESYDCNSECWDVAVVFAPAMEAGPRLLHSDLWVGNMALDGQGFPVVLNPASW